MIRRSMAAIMAAACLLGPPWRPASAANPMGYRVLSAQEAATLPHNHGALGLDVERAQQITDDGMTFEIMRIKQVRHGSPGAQAGFSPGDQIIAVDGRVFPSIAAFAAYIGSMPPGSRVTIDYIPAGAGPEQAQRVGVGIGLAGAPAAATSGSLPAGEPPAGGMSTRTKIGIGAAALLGCYALGCFSHSGGAADGRPQPQQPYGAQQR